MDVNDLIRKLREGDETILDIAGTEADRKLTVSIRKLNPEEARPPKRAESLAKKHEFLAAASLAAYLARYGGENTVVFADPVGECISAVMDEKATQGFEVVTMRPAIHPLWKPWADLAGKPIEFAEFASFIDQNRRVIVSPDARELRMLLSQIKASVNVEVYRGRGKNALNGLLIRTKIQNVDKDEEVELPDSITICVPLYVDTPKVTVELDLTIEADRDGEVSVVLSAGTVAEARVNAFEAMVEVIRVATEKSKATLTFGKPQHGPWSYLPEIR